MATKVEGKKKKMVEKLRRFRLRQGVAPHYEPNDEFDSSKPASDFNPRDIEILPGEVVESRRRLDQDFVNKFDRVSMEDDEEERGNQGIGGEVHDPNKDPNKDRPVRTAELANVNAQDRFLEEDELEDGEGDAPDKEELRKLSKGKFGDAAESEEDEGAGAEEDEEEAQDVTKEFAEAKSAGLQVFKKDNKYFVHEKGEDKPMKGNLKGKTKKSSVKQFIKEQAAKQEEEDEE